MPHLEMDTVVGRISLDGYVEEETGFQAVAGLTGMGLPSVDTRWVDSASDGAIFRHSRARSRFLDVPLWLHAPDRAGLKDLVSTFSSALSGPITLRWVDGSRTYMLDCRHVGGGDIVYGADTTGETDLRTIVTLQAGDPYWRDAASITRNLDPGVNTVVNLGTAPTPIQWTLKGPLTAFSATSPEGRRLGWSGSLPTGGELRIHSSGRVVDPDGVSHYHELDPAPKFWHLPGGTSDVTLTKSGTGTVSATWNPRYRMVI